MDLTRTAYESIERAKNAIACEKWRLAFEESDLAVENFIILRSLVQKKLQESLYLRAKAYLGQNKFFRAKQNCEFMINLKNGPSNIQDSADDYGEESSWHTLIGQAHTGMNQLELAKDSYRKALLLNPNNKLAKDGLSYIFKAQTSLSVIVPNAWNLPEEMWILIFSHLDIKSHVQIELVCKKWHRIAPSSWKFMKAIPGNWWSNNLPISTNESSISPIKPDYFCGLVKKCGQWCKTIDLGCVDISRVRLVGAGRFHLRSKLRQLLTAVCLHCPNLATLNIPSAALLDEDLREIFQSLPYLTSLSLEKVCRTPEGLLEGLAFDQAPVTLREIRFHFAPSSPCLTDLALCSLADRVGKRLDHFKLCSDWDNFCSEESLAYLLDTCYNLTTVKLGCLGQEAGERLTTACLVRLGRLRNLTSLYLWIARISNTVISALVQGCQKLVSLELHAEIVDLEDLGEISKFRGLNDLRLDVISALPWATLLPPYAFNNERTLKILALSGLNEPDLSIALESFPVLEQLCMWNSVNIDSAALVVVINKHKPTRLNPLKLIASCYHLRIDQQLADVMRESPQFSLGCYFDHHPCDLALSQL